MGDFAYGYGFGELTFCYHLRRIKMMEVNLFFLILEEDGEEEAREQMPELFILWKKQRNPFYRLPRICIKVWWTCLEYLKVLY